MYQAYAPAALHGVSDDVFTVTSLSPLDAGAMPLPAPCLDNRPAREQGRDQRRERVSSDFDRTDGDGEAAAVGIQGRRLVGMQVGSATVFVEAVGPAPAVEQPEEFRPVSVDPKQAFETASEALKECVQVVGERIEKMAQAARPDEVGIEFTIAFEVAGKATIIPVLLTGAAKTQLGVKVTAKWQLG
jgi:hypothetical protein